MDFFPPIANPTVAFKTTYSKPSERKFYNGLRLYRIKRLASEHHDRKSFMFLKKRLGRLCKARYSEKQNKNCVEIYRNQGH